jgi:hypothetical protein
LAVEQNTAAGGERRKQSIRPSSHQPQHFNACLEDLPARMTHTSLPYLFFIQSGYMNWDIEKMKKGKSKRNVEGG